MNNPDRNEQVFETPEAELSDQVYHTSGVRRAKANRACSRSAKAEPSGKRTNLEPSLQQEREGGAERQAHERVSRTPANTVDAAVAV